MEIKELEIALFLYGGNMEYIKRPKQVSRAEKQVLTPRNEQNNTQEQFSEIYNYLDEVKKNFDNIPELPIIETITNSNGTAIKFPDGTMICIKAVSFSNVAFSNPQGSLYFCLPLVMGKFAEPFISVFATTLEVYEGGGIDSGLRYTSTTEFGQANLFRGDNTTQSKITLRAIAIGKWKK